MRKVYKYKLLRSSSPILVKLSIDRGCHRRVRYFFRLPRQRSKICTILLIRPFQLTLSLSRAKKTNVASRDRSRWLYCNFVRTVDEETLESVISFLWEKKNRKWVGEKKFVSISSNVIKIMRILGEEKTWWDRISSTASNRLFRRSENKRISLM